MANGKPFKAKEESANIKGFVLESHFQEFLKSFPGMPDHDDVIDMLRDFYYTGAARIMSLPPNRAMDAAVMWKEYLAYSAMKEAEYYAENN